MALILDTNAVSALFTGDAVLGELLGAVPRPHLPVVVIGEYRFGLLSSRQRARLAPLLEALMRASTILPIDANTAAEYSRVRQDLRRIGRPIPQNDAWIAALARQHQQPVLSRDAHFDEVPGLRRVSW